MILAIFSAVLLCNGCGVNYSGGLIGLVGIYNYSPSVIQTGSVRQFWWCSQTANPTNPSQHADVIVYETVNQVTGAVSGPKTVLAETAGAWDSNNTCNPKVIGGAFTDPLGDGQTYDYAMYYVATADDGFANSIGVAFSKDGMNWKKYPRPVIQPTVPGGWYGVGQPAVYNRDQKSGISIFYEVLNSSVSHVAATSTDGVHFTVQGTLTTNGLDPDCPEATWGDMAYDRATGYWYAVFNRQLRDPSTTGGIGERGQLGVELYKIPAQSLLTGATPWQQLTTIDTNLTGFEANFIAGFVRDLYGNVNVGSYPTIEMYVSISYPQPDWNASPRDAANSAEIDDWRVRSAQWIPGQPLRPFYQYFNNKVHEVTTGWASSGFREQLLLGHLYESPQSGATRAFYGCKDGDVDYFVSLDSACEGKRILGKNGYGYSQPNANLGLIALYRCSTGYDHFVSKDPKCGGENTDELLGYALP
jgi:hypothetical protein